VLLKVALNPDIRCSRPCPPHVDRADGTSEAFELLNRALEKYVSIFVDVSRCILISSVDFACQITRLAGYWSAARDESPFNAGAG
jgi:hypothetical protein